MAHNFSPIQNHILTTLKNAKSLRYSELNPGGIANDLFNYHLQFIVKKGFVDRAENGYSLSAKGVKHVADPYPQGELKEITSLFKVNVITIVSKEMDGEIFILNQLRQCHPSYGKVGVMGGTVRKGEPTGNAAKRKLKIETGLDADLEVIGIERRMLYVKDELFSDVMFPISYTDTFDGTLQDTEFGANIWVPVDQALKNDAISYDSIESISKVLKAIKNGTIKDLPFFYNETIQKGSSM